jgi:hypothetical protein
MAPQAMRTSSVAAFAWIIMLGMAAWVVGMYPTYHLSGTLGLTAQAVANIIVLIATCVSVVIIRRLAVRGPRAAAIGMLLSGIARLLVIVVAVLVVRWLFVLPLLPFMIWTGLFYVVMFGGEVIWLTRALSEDNFLAVLGDISRENWPVRPACFGDEDVVEKTSKSDAIDEII